MKMSNIMLLVTVVDTRVLNQAKGSAYIELENTKVMAGV